MGGISTWKQEAIKFLADVPEEHVFWCNDGRVMKNVRELKDAFHNMPDEVFAYHASSDKNDFVNWVADIIRDEKLAKDLKKATNRSQAERAVASRIAILEKRLV